MIKRAGVDLQKRKTRVGSGEVVLVRDRAGRRGKSESGRYSEAGRQ